jgi:hypothetical protein
MKNWVTNDAVTAADLNDIAFNGNLAFANAAARDAFLVGDMAPVPGLTVYMIDDGNAYRYVGAGGWVPAHSIHMVTMFAPSYFSMNSNAVVQATGMTTFPPDMNNRNFGGCWANDKFTPKYAGFYELEAALIFTHATAVDGYRAVWLSLNGASLASAIPGSWNSTWQTGAPAGTNTYVQARSTCCYFNGTDGSYVTIMGQQSSTSTLTIWPASFSAKYLGM